MIAKPDSTATTSTTPVASAQPAPATYGGPLSAAELYQCRGTRLDIACVEYRKIAAVFPRAPYHRQQPTIALGGVRPTFDEYWFGDSIAGGQQILAAPRSITIDVHHAGQRAEHR